MGAGGTGAATDIVTSRTVVVVGGGPAGAVLATYLARAALEVTLVERAPAWRWRACGVFSSPATMAALRRVGLAEADLARVARAIPAMRLETTGGAVVRLTYGAAGAEHPTAVGFDRSALDPLLLATARAAGVDIRTGVTVRSVSLAAPGGGAELDLVGPDGATRLTARIVVGADGANSSVARAAGVHRATRLGRRVGLSHHLPDPRIDELALDGRLRVLRDGYVGIAPVPGRRVNIGIVLGRTWSAALAARGADAVAAEIVAGIPPTDDDPAPWRGSDPCERVAGAAPLGVRVTRRAGPGWLLVGDAAGFLDPFTGEGLHRALVSAELGASAVRAALDGPPGDGDRAMAAYERSMRRRFATKDAVSTLVQLFLARPALLEYAARRLAARPGVRATMSLVMGDLVPASRGLDPRFLAALLAP